MRRMAQVLGVALLLTSFLAAQRGSGTGIGTGQMVYENRNNQWFEGPSGQVEISADGQWALFSRYGRVQRLVSLKTGTVDSERLESGLDSVQRAAFCGSGGLARYGERGGAKGWFLASQAGAPAEGIPDDAALQCSPDGRVIAYYRLGAPDQGIWAGHPGDFKNYRIPGEAIGMAFSPKGDVLYGLGFRADGASSLVHITLATGLSRTVASDLDASPLSSSIAVSADGDRLFLALAGPGAPNNEQRHEPDAPRWLKIYELDPETGARHPVIESASQDNFGPKMVGGELYWVRNSVHSAIALVPAQGGNAKELAMGFLPMWSPDGQRISYVVGGWRRADWGLNLDAAVVKVDAEGQRVSGPKVLISGYHEDFPAAWSPDGRWIAYHSHRSKIAVPEYGSPDSTDDVYLRRADDVHAPEIRLTNFGWETGSAYWSPDGHTLIFSSWVKGGEPAIDRVWTIMLDPKTGDVLHTDPLPLPSDIRSAQWQAWSPDGKEIALEDNQGGTHRGIWVVQPDGSHAHKVIDYQGTTYDGLSWTPDGKAIVYSGLAEQGMQLFVISRDGGKPEQLTHDTGDLLHPMLSPDGRWIACTRIVQSQQIWKGKP